MDKLPLHMHFHRIPGVISLSKKSDSFLLYGTFEATLLLDIIYLKVDRQSKR